MKSEIVQEERRIVCELVCQEVAAIARTIEDETGTSPVVLRGLKAWQNNNN